MDATESRREKQLAYNAEHGCEMQSTKGSTMLSIFDLLKDQIQEEEPLEYVGSRKSSRLDLLNMPTTTVFTTASTSSSQEVETDHLPSKPGVYFWKDADGKILYVGKAKKLRNRVKSYLSPQANHSSRIRAMLAKATQIDFVLTPSDRDALILESNLIKHHQPLYNVLLKDDEAYPYICASIGDSYPRFSIAPRRQEGTKAAKYKYFGPYPHFKEINAILEGIEAKYDLRAKSFAARHGGGDKAEYSDLFQRVLTEVFEAKGSSGDKESLPGLRSEFEEASNLFESKWNTCRDVVAIGKDPIDNKKAIVHVMQLRDGMVAGRFSYSCELLSGISGEEEYAALIETVLEKQHYPSGEGSRDGRTSFFPDEVLVQFPIDATELKKVIRSVRKELEPERFGTVVVRTAATRGQRKETDLRAMQFAEENAMEVFAQRSFENVNGATKTSLDGTASRELAKLLSLEAAPNRIECYDISHTQGEFTVGSRVVFVGGKPAPHLYRRFNIKTVDGVDDYASLSEVLERRFRRAWVNGSGGSVPKDSPWSLPDLVVIDGGRGQLGAAIKGMAKANVYPKLATNAELATGDGIIEETILDLQVKESKAGRKASIPVIALAKDKEEVFVPNLSDPVNETSDSAALLLLRSLRDESHRFALTAHRKRRKVVASEPGLVKMQQSERAP